MMRPPRLVLLRFWQQVGHFGGEPGGNLFCVFDGHGARGRAAAAGARGALPALLDGELKRFFLVRSEI